MVAIDVVLLVALEGESVENDALVVAAVELLPLALLLFRLVIALIGTISRQ